MMLDQLPRTLFATLQDHYTAVLIVVVLLYAIKNKFQRGLYSIPGPWLRSISTIPRLLSVAQGQSQEADLRLHEKYGKIVRVAPNIISIADVGEIGTLYGITTKFLKSRFYSLTETEDENGNLIPDPFILNDKALHSRMKRNAANAYSLNGLIQMEPYAEKVLERLINKLDSFAESGKACDLGEVLKNFAMDSVFAITFGADLDFMERGDTMGMTKTLGIFAAYMAIFGQIPWVHRFLLKNSRVAGWVLGEDASQAYIISLAERETTKGKSRSREEGPMTFIQRLVLNQKANPAAITDFEIVTHTFGNIAAGSDTTATAMRAVIYQLLKNERVYQNLCDAVRSSLTSPVRFADANAVPYIMACIQEGIRLHPSVGMILGREVPKGGATICNFKLGAGAEVGINPWIIHRDPQIFPQPNDYYPERWLAGNTDPEHLKLMNRAFLAFGHGAHTCSGRHISLLETVKLIPTLILHYDMEIVNGGKDYSFVNHWFTMQTGLMVRLTKRRRVEQGR